jgi:hypothetical protein
MEIKRTKFNLNEDLSWADFIATKQFKTATDITEALQDLENNELLRYYRDIIAQPNVYPKAKSLFDQEFTERDMREYICPDASWINRYYFNPKNLPEEPMLEVLTSKDGESLIRKCNGYQNWTQAELLILATLYCICLGKKDFVSAIRDYVKSIDTYTHAMVKFLNDHADVVYVNRIREIEQAVKQKYKL